MKFKAEIRVMPQKEILDPQGKAVKLGLQNLGIQSVNDVRVGRHIDLELDADSKEQAEVKVEEACKKLLANVIMETYSFSLTEI
jgi:phosphoribosylformylglycinamidine synthase PurS subunit